MLLRASTRDMPTLLLMFRYASFIDAARHHEHHHTTHACRHHVVASYRTLHKERRDKRARAIIDAKRKRLCLIWYQPPCAVVDIFFSPFRSHAIFMLFRYAFFTLLDTLFFAAFAIIIWLRCCCISCCFHAAVFAIRYYRYATIDIAASWQIIFDFLSFRYWWCRFFSAHTLFSLLIRYARFFATLPLLLLLVCWAFTPFSLSPLFSLLMFNSVITRVRHTSFQLLSRYYAAACHYDIIAAAAITLFFFDITILIFSCRHTLLILILLPCWCHYATYHTPRYYAIFAADAIAADAMLLLMLPRWRCCYAISPLLCFGRHAIDAHVAIIDTPCFYAAIIIAASCLPPCWCWYCHCHSAITPLITPCFQDIVYRYCFFIIDALLILLIFTPRWYCLRILFSRYAFMPYWCAAMLPLSVIISLTILLLPAQNVTALDYATLSPLPPADYCFHFRRHYFSPQRHGVTISLLFFVIADIRFDIFAMSLRDADISLRYAIYHAILRCRHIAASYAMPLSPAP